MCMINKIGVNHAEILNSKPKVSQKKKDGHVYNPSFKGVGTLLLDGLMLCESMPMVNVAVVDMLSAILPRTIVESRTNWFAGFEAFRRESSGLIVNCMIPGAVAYLIAKIFNNAFMPKGSGMASCWADSTLIDKAAEYYTHSQSKDKVTDTISQILGNIEGHHGTQKVLFKEALTPEEIEKYSKKFADIANKEKNGKEFKAIVDEIVSKTHISDNIKIDGKVPVRANSVETMMSDTVKFLRGFKNAKTEIGIQDFAQKSKKLVRTKSLIGLGIILPLAASMQYINRWITNKVSGVKGAPIYDDFGRGENIEETPKAKEGLLQQKFISIASMLGVSLLSMMKMPSMNMLEFKGIFPTMDQARIISTCTFASRMAAADDKNELAEATVRDIVTFSGLYFLGDYAAKAVATLIQKTTGTLLLNDTKPLKGDENILQRIKHWVKDVNVKSSKEVISKTKEALKGAKPTEAQSKIIKKELKHAVYLREACQAANLGVSLLLLGLIVPIFTRRRTEKKHREALAKAGVLEMNSEDKYKKQVA